MDMNTLTQKAQTLKLGKNSVVVLPVSVWDTLRGKMEEMQEDIEMYTSKNYKKIWLALELPKKKSRLAIYIRNLVLYKIHAL